MTLPIPDREDSGSHPWSIAARLPEIHKYSLGGSRIQVVEHPDAPAPHRWTVAVLTPDLHLDTRFPIGYFSTDLVALSIALALARRLVPGAVIEPWCGQWIAKNGHDSVMIVRVPCH